MGAADLVPPLDLTSRDVRTGQPPEAHQIRTTGETEEVSLDVGSMNFGETGFVNIPAHLRIMARAVADAGVKPELEVFEAGKPWAEADADTAEAIDFLEFYAREAYRWGGEQPITKIASAWAKSSTTSAGKRRRSHAFTP